MLPQHNLTDETRRFSFRGDVYVKDPVPLVDGVQDAISWRIGHDVNFQIADVGRGQLNTAFQRLGAPEHHLHG